MPHRDGEPDGDAERRGEADTLEHALLLRVAAVLGVVHADVVDDRDASALGDVHALGVCEREPLGLDDAVLLAGPVSDALPEVVAEGARE